MKVRCPHCGAKSRVPEGARGRMGVCPVCSQKVPLVPLEENSRSGSREIDDASGAGVSRAASAPDRLVSSLPETHNRPGSDPSPGQGIGSNSQARTNAPAEHVSLVATAPGVDATYDMSPREEPTAPPLVQSDYMDGSRGRSR